VSALTVAALLQHARRFGAEGVWEVAERELGPLDLAELAHGLAAIHVERDGVWRLAPAQREDLVLRLAHVGVGTRRTAELLCVDVRSVQRTLQAARAASAEPDTGDEPLGANLSHSTRGNAIQPVVGTG
jgi:hypothetical protein